MPKYVIAFLPRRTSRRNLRLIGSCRSLPPDLQSDAPADRTLIWTMRSTLTWWLQVRVRVTITFQVRGRGWQEGILSDLIFPTFQPGHPNRPRPWSVTGWDGAVSVCA